MTRGVSIVIPTWNGLELLKRFLPSVIAAAIQYSNQLNAHTEIVIVDDGSLDESVEWLLGQGFVEVSDVAKGRRGDGARERDDFLRDRSAPTLKLIKNDANCGFGETCNRGFDAARYPLVFLLNNDVKADVNSIAPLVENFDDPSVFAAHCRVFDLETGQECGNGKIGGFARGFIRVHRSYVPQCANVKGREEQGTHDPLYSMFAGGGSAMFDRDKFLEIGGFERLLSPFYWEDVELSYRAWKRGYSVLYEPRSVAHHRVSSTIGKLDQRAVHKVEQRNRLIYHWIHLHDRRMMASHVLWAALLVVTAPLRLKPAFISSCFSALKLLPEIQRRRVDEKQSARRSDRDVFDIFASLEKRTDVFSYDDYCELEETRAGVSN